MAADGVDRSGSENPAVCPDDLAVRHQTQLDQRLEAVADTKRQTVPLIQELLHCLFDASRCWNAVAKNLRGTVRLVTCGEAAGEHDDLCLADSLLELLYRITDILCRQVAEYLRQSTFAPALSKALALSYFTVGAGEYRDKYRRLDRSYECRSQSDRLVVQQASPQDIGSALCHCRGIRSSRGFGIQAFRASSIVIFASL